MTFLVLIAAIAVDGFGAFVVAKLWCWFMPGIFPSAPMLSFAQAWGLMLILSMARAKLPGTSSQAKGADQGLKGTLESLFQFWVFQVIALVLGAGVRFWLMP